MSSGPCRSLVLAATLVLGIAGTANAQGGSYGGAVISPGAPPVTLNGTSGGPRPAQSFGGQCRGSIAVTPDHIFRLTAPATVRFEVLRSPGDTTLVVMGPSGVLCDDDSGNGNNPRVLQALAPGDYQVFVGSYVAGQLHPYTIRVGTEIPRYTVGLNAPVQGAFVPGLPVDRSNRPFMDYSLQITTPGVYRIDLTSGDASAYDPYLYLLQGRRQLDTNDDGGGYPNSRIERQLNPGSYTVRVSSFRTGQVQRPASFTLAVTQVGYTPPPPPGPNPGLGIPGARLVAPGVPAGGSFGPGLPIEPGSGRAYIDFALTIVMPGTYQLDLTSANASTYDPYLRLMMVNGTEIASDDDGGGYPNSRIMRQLAPGLYRVRVSSFRRGQVSVPTAFSLSVQPR